MSTFKFFRSATRCSSIAVSCLFASCIGLLYSSQLIAQSETKALPWYQIEVVIFENRGYSNHGPDAEAWPRDIFLAYPAHSQYLLTAEELKELEEKERAANQEAGLSASAFDEKLSRAEKPFIDLGEAFFQLKQEKNALYRERNLRVLYHKVWRQPVGEREDGAAVVIAAGNLYDGHQELEGSLKISVSRYLHVDANLWFTSFEANIGQEDTRWPNLPAPPLRGNEESETLNKTALDKTRLKTTTPPWVSNDDKNSNIRFGMNTGYADENKSEQNALKNYVTKEIIQLEQSRRMRSGELHYLDHPKLGLIIRIDTYTKAANSDAQANSAYQ